jgi:hypothetical protein
MKNLLKHTGIYQLYIMIKESTIDDWKDLFIIIAPLFVIFVVFNILILFTAFMLWQLPNEFYLPFHGGNVQGFIERGLIVFGLVLFLSKKLRNLN